MDKKTNKEKTNKEKTNKENTNKENTNIENTNIEFRDIIESNELHDDLDDTKLDSEEDFESEEVEMNEEYQAVLTDDLDITISLDDIEQLSEEESLILAQKVEVAISKYEDIAIIAQQKGLSYDEAIDEGYDVHEHKRLKLLESSIYQHVRELRRSVKSEGFFAVMPVWSVVLFVCVAILTVFPVSPFLPIYICTDIVTTFVGLFESSKTALNVVFYSYTFFFLLIELVCLLILGLKGRKSKEKQKAFKAFLVLVIINIILVIPSIIMVINNMSNL